jgi:4-aminobutyrate aminotransferase
MPYLALSKQLSFKTTIGNVLTLTLPLTLTAAEMEVTLGISEECIDEVERTRKGDLLPIRR